MIATSLRLCDAHNHLHDERLRPHREAILSAVRAQGLARMVVNGSSESDWPEALALARACPEVIPSFGYHPWYVKERSGEWQSALLRHLDAVHPRLARWAWIGGSRRLTRGHRSRCSCGNYGWRPSAICR